MVFDSEALFLWYPALNLHKACLSNVFLSTSSKIGFSFIFLSLFPTFSSIYQGKYSIEWERRKAHWIIFFMTILWCRIFFYSISHRIYWEFINLAKADFQSFQTLRNRYSWSIFRIENFRIRHSRRIYCANKIIYGSFNKYKVSESLKRLTWFDA